MNKESESQKNLISCPLACKTQRLATQWTHIQNGKERKKNFPFPFWLALTMGCDTKSCLNKQNTDINTKQIFGLNSVGGNTNAVCRVHNVWKMYFLNVCHSQKGGMNATIFSIHNNHTSSKTIRYYLTKTNADLVCLMMLWLWKSPKVSLAR